MLKMVKMVANFVCFNLVCFKWICLRSDVRKKVGTSTHQHTIKDGWMEVTRDEQCSLSVLGSWVEIQFSRWLNKF
jgi:hypothetical protein